MAGRPLKGLVVDLFEFVLNVLLLHIFFERHVH